MQIFIESAYMYMVGTRDTVVLQVEFTAKLTLRWRPGYVQDIFWPLRPTAVEREGRKQYWAVEDPAL